MKVMIAIIVSLLVFPLIGESADMTDLKKVKNYEYISGADVRLINRSIVYYRDVAKIQVDDDSDFASFFIFRVENKEHYFKVVIVRDRKIRNEKSNFYGSGGEFHLDKASLKLIHHSIFK